MNELDVDFTIEAEGLPEKLRDLHVRKTALKKMEENLKELKNQIREEEESVFAEMEQSQIQSMKVGNTLFYCRTNQYMSLRDKERGFAWLEAQGFDYLIKPTVNSQAMTAELKAFKEDGGEIPDEIVSTRTVHSIGMRNS